MASYTGTVKSFNPYKGWGFIESPAVGADCFLLKGELGGFAVNKGDQVSFEVTQGPKGNQASNVKVTATTDGKQSFYGEVKSWNESKGYGFISSTASGAVFGGKDVFALRTEFEGIPYQGAPVLFKASLTEKGPAATEIKVLGQGGGASQSWGSWGGGMQWGKGSWGGGYSAGGFGGGSWKTPSETEVYFGTIKAINEEKGWGHITCDSLHKIYGKEVFVMKSNLEGLSLAPGTPVVFNVSQGMKGPHAINLKPFDAQKGAMLFTGSVKMFNEAKGWGFVASPSAGEVFGTTDIFVHKRDLGERVVKEGDQVNFSVDVSSGRASAKLV